MNVKSEKILLSFSTLSFGAITVSLFFPHYPLVAIFTLYLTVVFGVQALGKPAFAFMMAIFTTLLGVFCMSQVGKENMLAIPFLIVALWGGIFLLHLYQEKISSGLKKISEKEDQISKDTQLLKKEIDFYNGRKKDLEKRAGQRRHLLLAARELGSLLDPGDIQERLLDIARSLFSGFRVHLSHGQNPDAIDSYVMQKGQPLLIPTKTIKGNPLLAVPILMQGAVAGVLRVGGEPGPEFTREDLRLLDILASLASLSLENSALFTQVQETALRDNLTGLWTHRAFSDQLEASLLEASRYGQSLSIILSDVDHFKSVNDTHGHQAGDQILQGFSHILVRNVRDVDIVSRYGGEEFTVLLLQTSQWEAAQVAEKIRQNLEAQEFDIGKKNISVTASFGVATFPQDATSAQQLMRVADQRLYAAKKAGRNQVQGRAAA